MSDLNQLAVAMLAALREFPDNGKPPNNEITTCLVVAGFIERREITKPCRECGTARPDYSYCKITDGGKLFMALGEAKP